MEFSPHLSSQKSNKIPIAQYIQQNKWNKVIKLLTSKDGADIMTKRNRSGLSLLAFAISHKPPLNVVETMLRVNPSLVHQADTNGHLPLHIACAIGCSSDLINVLLEQDGKDAVSKPATFNQRCPLHYTCMYILNPHWYENSKILSDRSMQTEDEPSVNISYHKKNTIRRSRSHQEEFSLKSKESKSKRPHPPESFSGATIMTLKYEDFEDQLLVLRKLISIDPHVLNARDKYGYAPIDYFQDFVAENNEISPRWERCDIISDILRSESIKLYKAIQLEYESKGINRSDAKSVPSNGDEDLELDSIWGALTQLEIDKTSHSHIDVNSAQGSHTSIGQNQQENLKQISEGKEQETDQTITKRKGNGTVQ